MKTTREPVKTGSRVVFCAKSPMKWETRLHFRRGTKVPMPVPNFSYEKVSFHKKRFVYNVVF